MKFVEKVAMPDGSFYPVKSLLGRPNSNTKILKSNKYGQPIQTVSLSLAPANASGFNLCSSASHACKADCLFTSGYAAINPRTIQPARIAKSRFLRINPSVFFDRLCLELKMAEKNATKKGLSLYARLNTISDVMWEREFPSLFHMFPDVLFYDYTKHFKRMERYANNQLPDNYHLTFSWSGNNLDKCLWVLNNGANVAVPFDVKYYGEKRRPLPPTWKGFTVIDGDITDLRPLDPQGGYVIGLRAKGKAKKDKTSGFVQPGEIVL